MPDIGFKYDWLIRMWTEIRKSIDTILISEKEDDIWMYISTS